MGEIARQEAGEDGKGEKVRSQFLCRKELSFWVGASLEAVVTGHWQAEWGC